MVDKLGPSVDPSTGKIWAEFKHADWVDESRLAAFGTTSLAAAAALDRPLPVLTAAAGDWVTSQQLSGAATSTAAQDTMYPMPLYLPAAQAFNSIAVNVNTAVATGVIRLGAYAAAAGNKPGALLFDAGTVDASTTGVKQAAIAQTIGPGLVWLVAVHQVANVKARAFTSPSTVTAAPAPVNDVITTPGSNSYQVAAVSGALPSAPTWVFVPNVAASVVPIVGLVAA